MLCLSNTEHETESQVRVGKACLNFWLQKLYLFLDHCINGVRLILPWFRKHTVQICLIRMLNLWVVSLNKQRVSFSLSLSKRKINDRLPLPSALQRAVIKKMTVLVTASTSFAQIPKLPSFNTEEFRSDKDAENRPDLKTTIGYTNSQLKYWLTLNQIYWYIHKTKGQKQLSHVPALLRILCFTQAPLKAAENPGFGSNTPRNCTVPRGRGMCPLAGRFAVGVYPLCWPGASAGSPAPRAPSNSWGTSPKSHFPVRSVEQSSSGLLWL